MTGYESKRAAAQDKLDDDDTQVYQDDALTIAYQSGFYDGKKAAQSAQEPVAVKHMMEWVDCLKRKSDYGQHLKIPSEMSAGACWELAIELEQFINTTPPQRSWVDLTDEEITKTYWSREPFKRPTPIGFAREIEQLLKEKNT